MNKPGSTPPKPEKQEVTEIMSASDKEGLAKKMRESMKEMPTNGEKAAPIDISKKPTRKPRTKIPLSTTASLGALGMLFASNIVYLATSSTEKPGCQECPECILPPPPPPNQCKKGDLKDCTKQCEEGHMGSCNTLGTMYDHGKGVPEDDKKAMELYNKACDGGEPKACYNLGYIYDHGKGVPEDDEKASEFYKKACDGGDPGGCNTLGVMYDDGKGVPEDDEKAVELFKKACDGGSGLACRNVGLMYDDGKGVAANRDKSIEYFRKACDRGRSKTCKWLREEGLKLHGK